MGTVPPVERLGRWPDDDEPGRFVIQCSCRRWNAIGTVAEIQAATRHHDDSPFRVVLIWGKVIAGEPGRADPQEVP